MSEKAFTIFCDIDGTLLKHMGSLHNIILNKDIQWPIHGVLEKIEEWSNKEYMLVLTTARPESMRTLTERQLENWGISYHILLMGMRHGPRVVINDEKPDGTQTAIGITLKRDVGIGGINL